ncbi:MAG: PDZ domain-containing protein [Acidobacteria bacterium]|nr:PDZ domain-containing protein [Acidobacteriota bacterium]
MTRDAVSLLGVALVCAGAALVGGNFGETLGRPGRVTSSDVVTEETGRFRQALDLIQQNFADPVDPEAALYHGAIPGMLARLDPHSQFFDPERFERLREEQRGEYAGVGMQIRLFRNDPIVDFPFPGTPAFRAGVRPGDVIQTIDGIPTSGLDVDEVARRVRGRPGTSVRLALSRGGGVGRLDVALERDEIIRPTIPISFELQPGVGYLRITSFGQTTGTELHKALDDFSKHELRGLVIDLRDNPGGLLQASVDVAGSFLEPGAAIVSHRGRNERRQRYRAPMGGSPPSYPITVLVNCRSASASEIVAGALQDHDRALIVGSNTFGKGLVQSIYTLPSAAGLTLTTARYYTPSGRQIQRDWEGLSRDAYYADPCESTFEPQHSELRHTTSGRTVYGGGGIAPDVYMPEQGLTEVQRRWLDERVFARFAETLDTRTLSHAWRPDRATLDSFQSYLVRESPETAGYYPDNQTFVRRYLAGRVLTAAFDVDLGARAEAEADPMIQSAAARLDEAARLLNKRPSAVARAD